MVKKPDASGDRSHKVEFVRISEMRVSPKTQRKFRKEKAEKYASELDIDAIGLPILSYRDGNYWIVDGQHRIAALKIWGGEQAVECIVHYGLNEEGEAELFLTIDNRTAIPLFEKFRIAIHAGRPDETEIQEVVQGLGLKISTDSSEKSISAVSSLKKVHSLGGKPVLRRTLNIEQCGFAGDLNAFRAEIIVGLGRVCQRYNGSIDDAQMVERLSALQGGAMALIRKGNSYREKTGRPKDDCIAAASVDVYNSGRGGKKVEPWWK